MPIIIIYLKHNEQHNNNESRIMTRISDYDIAVIENESTPDARYSIERNKQAFDMFIKGKDYREEIT